MTAGLAPAPSLLVRKLQASNAERSNMAGGICLVAAIKQWCGTSEEELLGCPCPCKKILSWLVQAEDHWYRKEASEGPLAAWPCIGNPTLPLILWLLLDGINTFTVSSCLQTAF